MTVLPEIPEHGGQVELVMRAFPEALEPFIDLSTGISPYPYPFGEVQQTDLVRLPEHGEETRLIDAAMQAYGVQSSKLVVTGPGTQLLISLLPYVLKSRQVIVLGPTYSGHATAWRNAGSDVHTVNEIERFREETAQPGRVGILCNPNNPDGRCHDPLTLLALAERCTRVGSHLIIDEAYADFENHISVAPYLPHPALSVLRSFGKTYGLPGIRLGFLLTAETLAERMRGMLGAWAVGTAAITIGCKALNDREWLDQQKTKLVCDMQRFLSLCRKRDISVVGHTSLFALARSNEAPDLWAHLCKQGIVTRSFSERLTDIRFGLPRSEAGWQRLEHAFKTWCS
ncbi:threonine-phosphate decarboxylase CobD [Acetobacter sp. UBA5411]|uniref:threonine-phosphate decarboxylase CobD n=1 Tax=Acetobacter sp. UBA5411 TaxID=1945905 RepID=UPI0025BC5BC5|nr:threonine-phosphate decarboxylase CobD [Acetobacter sp. UBA5411]